MKNGKPDFLAIDIYTHALRHMCCFEYHTDYNTLCSLFRRTKYIILDRITKLEKLGLLKLESCCLRKTHKTNRRALVLIMKDNELVKEFNKNKDYSI